MVHNTMGLKTKGQKYKKTITILKNVQYQMWYIETPQPIRDESYPHLPSKPIRDEVDEITTIRVAMSNNRSAGLQVNVRKSLKTLKKVRHSTREFSEN